MVEEAQALRARVLGDLSKRRKVLHAQIEQLRAGRERLAQTVLDARRSVDAIAGELFSAEDNARLAAESAGREALERSDEVTPEELAAHLLADEHEAAVEAGLEPPATGAAPASGSTVSGTRRVGGPADAGDEVDVEGSDADPAVVPAAAEVDELFAKIRAARLEDDEPGAAPGNGAPEPTAALSPATCHRPIRWRPQGRPKTGAETNRPTSSIRLPSAATSSSTPS